jgi:serine/threonine protein kinase
MPRPSRDLLWLLGRAAAMAFAAAFVLDVAELALGWNMRGEPYVPQPDRSWFGDYVSRCSVPLAANSISVVAVIAFLLLLAQSLGVQGAVWLLPFRKEDETSLATLWEESDRGDDAQLPRWPFVWLSLFWWWAAAEVARSLTWPWGYWPFAMLLHVLHLPVAFLGALLCYRLVARACGEELQKRNLASLSQWPAARGTATPPQDDPGPRTTPPSPPSTVASTQQPPAGVADVLPAGTTCPGCRIATRDKRCRSCGVAREAGSYRIESVLASNVWRRTYRAAGSDGVPVVLKELAFATVPDASTLDAFDRQAKSLSRLRHRGIPPLRAAFAEGSGTARRLYLVYAWVEGTSLEAEMAQRTISEEETLGIVEQLLEILSYLQERVPPVIHRDVKPSNVILRADGTVALIDFGAVREIERTLHSATLTGTVGYMPPEQMAGQVDPTTDLHAVGATALHVLSGRPPWELMDGPEVRVPALAVRPQVRRFLQRLVQPRRALRFRSAREAVATLQKARNPPGRLHLQLTAAIAAVAVCVVVARWSRASARSPAPAAAPAVLASIGSAPSRSAPARKKRLKQSPRSSDTTECCSGLWEAAKKANHDWIYGGRPEARAIDDRYSSAGRRCEELRYKEGSDYVVNEVLEIIDGLEVPAECRGLQVAPICMPGERQDCDGKDGCTGFQVCDKRGFDFGECQCGQ